MVAAGKLGQSAVAADLRGTAQRLDAARVAQNVAAPNLTVGGVTQRPEWERGNCPARWLGAGDWQLLGSALIVVCELSIAKRAGRDCECSLEGWTRVTGNRGGPILAQARTRPGWGRMVLRTTLGRR